MTVSKPASPSVERVPASKGPGRWALAALLLASTSAGAQMLALGPEFQVNTYSTNEQWNSDVAIDAAGNFVVVWASRGSYGTDTDSFSIQGQLFAADGTPRGGQFQVNSYTTFYQSLPAVAADPSGDFVVVWEGVGSNGTDTDQLSIQGQRFAADGAPLGGQFQVNTYTTGLQWVPDIAMDAAGNFVVVWQSDGSYGVDTDLRSVQGQRFGADGTPLGGQFQVNSYTPGNQSVPAVAADPSGDFVVVWTSDGSSGTDTDGRSIQGQRHAANGVPLGGEFQVNTYTTDLQAFPDVATDAAGDFVVVWQSNGSYGTDTDNSSIQGKRFAGDGTPLGAQFQINGYTTGGQEHPRVAVDAQGAVLIAWDSYGSWGTDGWASSIQAQSFEPDGSPIGGQIQVNSLILGEQLSTAVALGPAGQLVVAWSTYVEEPSGPDYDVEARQFQAFPFFYDGFESGDTSGWSSTMP